MKEIFLRNGSKIELDKGGRVETELKVTSNKLIEKYYPMVGDSFELEIDGYNIDVK